MKLNIFVYVWQYARPNVCCFHKGALRSLLDYGPLHGGEEPVWRDSDASAARRGACGHCKNATRERRSEESQELILVWTRWK